ncbi:MAG: ABC transporter permease [Deltaproteobacteria bacterium]|nr:ABC transporter permease [Deltaproteobacteria bacterium]
MLKNYLIISFKVFIRRKFYTFISLFGISFALMVLMVFFALYENAFGNIPPQSNNDRILTTTFVQFGGRISSRISSPGYVLLKHYLKVHTLPRIKGASIFSSNSSVDLVFHDRTIKVSRKRTDGGFWKIFDFRFLEGRPLTAEDEKNANYAAVINESTQKKLFGNKSPLGAFIELEGQPFRIVGVVPDVPSIRDIPYADIWVPLSTAKTKAYLKDGVFGNFNAVALAQKRADIPLIKKEYSERLQRLDYPVPEPWMYAKGRLETYFELGARSTLNKQGLLDKTYANKFRIVLLIGIFIFVFLPTINLININLSRILERASEIGVRRAFGASTRVLVAQFIVENILLTLIGGILAFGLSWGTLLVLNIFPIEPFTNLRFNFLIFFYGFAVTILFGVISGVYPAWKMSRRHPVAALYRGTM